MDISSRNFVPSRSLAQHRWVYGSHKMYKLLKERQRDDLDDGWVAQDQKTSDVAHQKIEMSDETGE